MVDGFLRQLKDAIVGPTDERIDSDSNYGDPADEQSFGNVRPASEDPYGDPADEQSFGNIRSASEDPYGDPADE